MFLFVVVAESTCCWIIVKEYMYIFYRKMDYNKYELVY